MNKAFGRQATLMPSWAPRNAEVTHKWKPGTAVYSKYNGMNWKEVGKYTFTYDGAGRTLTELQENLDKEDTGIVPFALIKTTYDDLGRAVAVDITIGETPDKLEPYQRQSIKYDPVLKYTVIEQISESFLGGEWLFDEQTYKRTITRDGNGNITDMTASTWYDDDFLEVEIFHTTYDGTTPKKMQTRFINQNEAGDFYWEDGETYSDCEWYETDGQMISLEDVTVGKNKLKACAMEGPDKQLKDIKMSIVYDGEDFTSTMDYMYVIFPTKVTNTTKYLANGGYTQQVETLQDLRPHYDETTQMIQNITEQYDDYGNLTIAKKDTFFGHAWIDSWTEGQVKYDETYGYPTDYLRREFTPMASTTQGDWADVYKIAYSDYIDLAGIESVSDIDIDAEPEYYTIEGRRIASDRLAPGLYVKVTGLKTEKIFVK